MEVEVVRLLTAALADPGWGVGPMLGALTRDGADPLPATPTIYSSVDTPWAARGVVPEPSDDSGAVAFPALIVRFAVQDLAFDPRASAGRAGWQQAATITVTIDYVAKDADTVPARRDASYVLRAVRGVLTVLASPSGAAARVRNGVRLETLQSLTQHVAFVPNESGILTGAISSTWSARETAPVFH